MNKNDGDFHSVYEKTSPTLKKNPKDIQQIFVMSALATSLPMTLLSGPLVGYLLSRWLIDQFAWNQSTTLVFVLTGLLGSVIQTIRLLKLLLMYSKRKEK